MKWKTAFKIYLSKTHKRSGIYLNKKRYEGEPIPYTVGDMLYVLFLAPITIPVFLFYVPILVYKIKKEEGVKEEYKKYFLYYKNDK